MSDPYLQATNELLTVRDWLRFAVSRFGEANLFFGQGTQSPFDEAAWLILRTLHLPPDELEPYLDARLTRSEIAEIATRIKRRVEEHMPVAYLTHEAWLGDCRFYVDERVIIPRSFIAELLRTDLAPWINDPDNVSSVLDLCTGSGCLAILAARHFPNARVDAVDLSPDALVVARKNVAQYELDDRVTLLEGDLFAPVLGKRYDLIISNPPYVTAEAMTKLPAEYSHEPEMALASGQDGLDHARQLIALARQHLSENGWLVVEIGFNREGFEAAFPDLPVIWAETSAGDGVVFLISREQL